jgi:hypothetical protein
MTDYMRRPPTPRGDVTRLPKWAQEHIHFLTRDLHAAYDRLSAGPEGALAFVDPHGDNRPLHDGHKPGMSATVRFLLPTRHEHGEHFFDVHVEDHELVVHLSGGATGIIHVLPSSINTIKLLGETAWERMRRSDYERGSTDAPA